MKVELEKGDCVKLSGLKSRAFNGCLGTLIVYIPSKGRWRLKLDKKTNEKDIIQVNAKHLIKLSSNDCFVFLNFPKI